MVLEDLDIVQGSLIHLQDTRLINRKKFNRSEIDWAKMTMGELSQTFLGEQVTSTEGDSRSSAMIDIMLMKFIEHHQLFEFIEVYKIYLKEEISFTQTLESLGGTTFLHLAVENSSTQIASYLLLDAKVDPNVLSHNF